MSKTKERSSSPNGNLGCSAEMDTTLASEDSPYSVANSDDHADSFHLQTGSHSSGRFGRCNHELAEFLQAEAKVSQERSVALAPVSINCALKAGGQGKDRTRKSKHAFSLLDSS